MKVITDVLESRSNLPGAGWDILEVRHEVWLNGIKLKDSAGRLSPTDVAGLDSLPACIDGAAPLRRRTQRREAAP